MANMSMCHLILFSNSTGTSTRAFSILAFAHSTRRSAATPRSIPVSQNEKFASYLVPFYLRIVLIRKIPWFNWRDAILYSKHVRSGGHKRTFREDKRPQVKTKRPQKTTKLKCPPLSRQKPVIGGHRRTRPFIQFQCVARALQQPDRTNHPYCTTTVTPMILCILWS